MLHLPRERSPEPQCVGQLIQMHKQANIKENEKKTKVCWFPEGFEAGDVDEEKVKLVKKEAMKRPSNRWINKSKKLKLQTNQTVKKKKEQHGGARIESDSSWATFDTWEVKMKTSLNGHCRHNLYLILISDSNIKIINAIYESYLIIMMTAPALIIHQQRNFLDAIASPCS